jgi:hypothetical protein
VPAFTADQSWVMDVVAEKAANRVLEKFFENGCPVPCARVDAISAAVFGRAETGVVGLVQRTTIAESEILSLQEARQTPDWRVRVLWGVGIALCGWAGLTLFAIAKDAIEHHWLGF